MSDVTVQRGSAALGNHVMGDAIIGGEADDPITYEVADITERNRASFGWWEFGRRIYGKGYPWTPFSRSVTAGGGVASIVLTSTSGAVLGRIRTDIQHSIFHSLKFTLDEKGCANFEMTLLALPPFPLVPMAIVKVNIGNTDFNWFTGIIEEAPDRGTARQKYVYRGFGLRKQLSQLIGEGTYPALTDVGEIVDAIVQDIIQPNSPIAYNASKINRSTGIFTVQEQEIDQLDLDKLFDTYAKMARARWGVDGDGDFFFETRDTTVIKNWFVGYHFATFEPSLNVEGVVNRIAVLRKLDTDTPGWTIGAIRNNLPSQAKYGIREFPGGGFQVSGVISDDDCEILAEALDEDLAEPKYFAQGKLVPVRTVNDYPTRGMHRVVDVASRFTLDVQDCDDSTEWTLANPGPNDLAKSTSEDILMSGAASLRLDWEAATGSSVTVAVSVVGAVKVARAWLRSNRAGSLVEFGIGFGAYTQNLRNVAFSSIQEWIPLEWDVSSLNLSAINQIGFRVLDSDAATTVWIDRVEFEMVGSRHYSMEINRAVLTFSPERQAMDVDWGPPPPRLHDYAAAALARSEENKAIQQRT